MEVSHQYTKDCTRLAALIELYTGIPRKRVFQFVMENAATELFLCANMVCDTEAQKEKLAALFEFKNIYETVKSAESTRTYKLDNINAAMGFFKNHYADANDKERFTAAYLDASHQVIAVREISAGTVSQAPVYPREIIKEALFFNAASVILAHNHPSGSEKPSKADIASTAQIKLGLETAGIQLLDHLIVARDTVISMVNQGHIPMTAPPKAPMAASPVRDNGSPYRTRPSILAELRTPHHPVEAGRRQADNGLSRQTKKRTEHER